jgi:hypothetical protein
MTKTEKKRFIRELIRNVSAEIFAKVPEMPEQWDGFELRQFIAEKFSDATYPRMMTGKRKADYENEVVVRNL